MHRFLIEYQKSPHTSPVKSECYWEFITLYQELWPASDFYVQTLTVKEWEDLQFKRQVTKKSLHVNNTRGKPSTFIFSLDFKTGVFKILFTHYNTMVWHFFCETWNTDAAVCSSPNLFLCVCGQKRRCFTGH